MANNNINAFSTLKIDTGLSRRWGASVENTVDPYISGYFFTEWAYLPSPLINYLNTLNFRGESVSTSNSNLKNVLASACLSCSLPGGSMNKAEFQGLGGITFGAPSNMTYDNNMSMRFLEFQNMPIHQIFHGWCKMIRDYRSGLSQLGNDASGPYTKKNYSATVYYWTTDPSGNDLQYAGCATGVFPMKDPTDLISGDLSAIDKLEVDIDFHLDYLWHEQWVYNACQKFMENRKSMMTVINNDYHS